MEQHSALSLIIEYLRSPDAQVRRNALTALGCVPSKEAFREIVRSALVDEDPKVRERAEDEIFSAGNPPPLALVDVLRDQFLPGMLPVPAYTLVGRLRGRGMAIRLPQMSMMRRIKLSLASRRRHPQQPTANLRRSAFVGSVIGAVALLLYINLTMRVNLGTPAALGLASSAFILPLAIMFFTRQWWSPIQRQPDRLTGGLLEILVLCFLGAGIGALLQSIFIAITHQHATGASIGISLLASALGLGAIRFGTLVAHGCFRGAMLNRIAQISVGFVAATLALTVILANIRRGQDTSAVLWPLMLPISFGLACAISAVDRESYITQSAQPIFRRTGRPLAALLLAAMVVPASFPLIPKKHVHVQESKFPRRIIPIESLPIKVELNLSTPQIAKFVVPEAKKGLGDFRIGLWSGEVSRSDLKEALRHPTDSSALDYQDDPPEINELLGPGTYQVVVDGPVTDNNEDRNLILSSVLPFMMSRIAQGLRPVEPNRVLCTLEISMATTSVSLLPTQTEVGQGAQGKLSPANLREEAEDARKEGSDLFQHSKYQAIAAYSRAIQIDPSFVEAYRARAHALSWLNNWALAISDEDKVISMRPRDKRAYEDRASYYEQLSQQQLAIQDRDKVVQLAPNDSTAYAARGEDYLILKQENLALQDCDKSLLINPDAAEAYICLGNIHMEQHKYDDALHDLESGIQVTQANSILYNNYGYLLNKLGRHQEALESLQKAIALNPAVARTHKNLGRSYLGLQKYKLALEELNKAIKLMPELAEAYQFRGDTKNKVGDPTGAAADWNKARELGYKAD